MRQRQDPQASRNVFYLLLSAWAFLQVFKMGKWTNANWIRLLLKLVSYLDGSRSFAKKLCFSTGGNSEPLVGAKSRPKTNLNNALLVTPHVSAATGEKRRKKPKNKSKKKKAKNGSFHSSSEGNTENSETSGTGSENSSLSGSSKANSPTGKSGSSSPSGASSTGAAIVL